MKSEDFSCTSDQAPVTVPLSSAFTQNPMEDTLDKINIEIEEMPPSPEQSLSPSGPSRKVQCALFVVFSLCFLIIAASSYYFFFHASVENEIVSVLVPQPFTENNDFMYFHLKNKMKVMLVKPNAGLNSTYVGKIKSFDCRIGI